MTNQWFLCRNESVQQTSFKEMVKNAKKGDMVNIENDSTKKIRLGVPLNLYWPFKGHKAVTL